MKSLKLGFLSGLTSLIICICACAYAQTPHTDFYAPLFTPPSAPFNLSATPTGTSVNLTWNYIKISNFNVVVLGSSTAEGRGASIPANSWVGRMRTWLAANTLSYTLTNLGVGGYNTCKILADGSACTFAPDPAKNITKALTLNPDLILINLPSNDVDAGMSMTETMANYRKVITLAENAGVTVFVTTTQPRSYWNDGQQGLRDLLKTQADSIRVQFGSRVIDIYDELTDFSNGKIIKAIYNVDGIHVNDGGHLHIFNEALKKVKRFTTTFEVLRSTDGIHFNSMGEVNSPSYQDENLQPGTTYYYKVRMVNPANNNSDLSQSAEVTIAGGVEDDSNPSVPTNLTLVAKNHNSATLQWDAATDNVGVTAYKITVNGNEIGSTPNTTFVVNSLLPTETYTITVKAVDAAENESDFSTATIVTTDPHVFYSLPEGNLTQLATWNTNQNGSGDTPTSFADNGQHFRITRSAEISTPLTIGGATSKVVIDNNVALTIAGTGAISAKLVVGDNVTLNIASTTTPNFETLAPTSTVVFNAYNATNSVPALRYGNLTLNGNGLKQIEENLLEVQGNLTLGNGIGLTGQPGNGTTVHVTGNITTGAIVPAASPDSRVGIRFTENISHMLTAGGMLSFYKLTADAGATVVFDDLTTTTPIILQLGSLTAGGGLELEDGSVLDIKNNTLIIDGDVTVNAANTNGKIAVTQGNIQLTTTATQNSNLHFLQTANNVETFTLNATGTGHMLIQEGLNIYNGLVIDAGVLESLGNVTIKSSASATASIREIKNGGSIVGDVGVERYMSGKKGYRYLSNPVEGVTVADWQTVIPVEGNFAGADGSGIPTLYWYHEPTGGHVIFPPRGSSNSIPFVKGQGYLTNILDSDERTLLTIGVPYQGDVTYTLTAGTGSSSNGWNLLGNPYASDIVWDNAGWESTDVGEIVWVRENHPDGSFDWKMWDRSIGQGSLENGKIPAGQAFWIQTGIAPQLTVKEAAKTTDAAIDNAKFYRTATETQSNLLSLELDNGGKKDFAYVKFTKDGIDGYTKLVDGVKKRNSTVNIATSSSDGIPLTVNDLPVAFCEKFINITIADVARGNYTLRFNDIENFEIARVQLIDAYVSKAITIDHDNAAYEITVNGDVASYKNRFSLKLTKLDLPGGNNLSAVKSTVCSTKDAAIVTLGDSQLGVTYEAVSSSSEILTDTLVGTGDALQFSIPVSRLSIGMNSIFVRASTGGGCTRLTDKAVSINKFEVPEITLSSADVYGCVGSDVTVIASGSGSTYVWKDLSNQFILPETGNALTISKLKTNSRYAVVTTNENGCESESKEFSVHAVNIETPTVTLSDGVLTANSEVADIQWFYNGREIQGGNSPVLPPVEAGQYAVRVANDYCSKQSSPFDFVVTNLPQTSERLKLKLYPNPAVSGLIHISGTSVGSETIDCYLTDTLGKLLFSTTILAEEYFKGLVINSLPSGLYLVRIHQKETSVQQKFIVN
jgi:chitodextrinase